jgi:regulator of replication initiation timing
MDDEEPSSGMGTLAAFALGRMSAHTEQVERKFARTMARRFLPQAPTVDVNSLLAENHGLLAENQELRRRLGDYERNYRALKAWADEAEAVLRANDLIGK